MIRVAEIEPPPNSVGPVGNACRSPVASRASIAILISAGATMLR